MYGKIFERMYTGSMMGSGAMMFAVWPYVIAHMKPNRDRTVFTVELNAQLMAVLIGEEASEIEGVLARCCEPDGSSRTPDKDGRKLVKLGTYLYEVVNGAVYDRIKREEELRDQNRIRQKRYYDVKKKRKQAAPRKTKAKVKVNGKGPLANEVAAVKALEGGDQEAFDRYAAEGTEPNSAKFP